MPCFSINQLGFTLTGIKNRSRLIDAISALGESNVRLEGEVVRFGSTYDGGRIHPDGRVELRGDATSRIDASKIKQSYSREVIKAQSKRFRWSGKMTTIGSKVVFKRGF